jgi:putative acetyltransferase
MTNKQSFIKPICKQFLENHLPSYHLPRKVIDTTMNNENISVRLATLIDYKELQQLFVDTVNTVCRKDYNEQQIKVWTQSVENEQRWLNVLTRQYVIVALHKNRIAGFCSLDNGDYIDLLFIHKDFQRKGIASKLYSFIEQEAHKNNTRAIEADVSITAESFFKKMGFEIMQEKKVSLKGVEMINYRMKKILNK